MWPPHHRPLRASLTEKRNGSTKNQDCEIDASTFGRLRCGIADFHACPSIAWSRMAPRSSRLHFVWRLENPSSKTVLSADVGKRSHHVEAGLLVLHFSMRPTDISVCTPSAQTRSHLLTKGIIPGLKPALLKKLHNPGTVLNQSSRPRPAKTRATAWRSHIPAANRAHS